MKTTKITSVLSLVLIFVTASAIFAGNNKVFADKLKVITYVVKVDNINILAANRHFLILITDGSGRQVAPAQTFRNGVSSYTFKEVGNKNGTRIAKMVAEPSFPGAAPVFSDSRTGYFLGGQSYLFYLRPAPGPVEAEGREM